MSIIAIAAVDENWGIGYNNGLLERIPEDMKRFKECVENSLSICGRKTFDTLPKRAFSQRDVYIITSEYDSPAWIPNTHNCCMKLERCTYLLEKGILEKGLNGEDRDVYIIGGASIYKQLLPYCDKLYLTKIYKTHDNVDAYFPLLDGEDWEIETESELKEYNGIKYSFINYKRVKT